ncbi:hypothetical protein CPC08DRAFT_777987, partial [Agrocybe pediades]
MADLGLRVGLGESGRMYMFATCNRKLPFPNVTFHFYRNVWKNAPEELKQRYISAGYTDQGLWKNFSNDVHSRFPDKKMPVMQSKQRRRRAEPESPDSEGEVQVVQQSPHPLVK